MRTEILALACLALIGAGTVVLGERPDAASTDLLRQVAQRYAYVENPGHEMVEAFSELARRGDPRASLWVARLHLMRRCGLPVDQALAQQMAKPVIDQVRAYAEAGDGESQFLLGACYHEGLGVDLDLEEAMKWYERAVQQKNINAYNNYAIILTQEPSVKQDLEKARRLLAEGAALGDHRSAFGGFDCGKPDAPSLRRRALMRGNKLVQTLGKPRAEALGFLVDSGIISRPEAYYDVQESNRIELTYEDDGVVLNVILDGRVRTIDIYPGMTESDRIRGGIPLGIDWDDTKDKIVNKLGPPDEEIYCSQTGQYTQSYRAGNIWFSLHSLPREDAPVAFWRIREAWLEAEPSGEGQKDAK